MRSKKLTHDLINHLDTAASIYSSNNLFTYPDYTYFTIMPRVNKKPIEREKGLLVILYWIGRLKTLVLHGL